MIERLSEIRKLDASGLGRLAGEVRELIIDVVSKNGGHLASSLGVVELTLALHHVFNTPADRIIWDVGHQSYAHKIITGRSAEFASLRKLGGLSGFPKISESPFDTYNTGHSSTSLSLALGEAVGRDLRHEKYNILPVIGDGSMTGGMAFEALNQIGHLKKDIIIILNDNEHSISKNVGALSEYLLRMITAPLYNRLRKRSYAIIKRIPRYGKQLYDFVYKQEARVKGFFVPGSFFEELGIRYFGPVDGHNLPLLIEVLRGVKDINNGPKIVHVITRKGKGYAPAEKDPATFHGIGPFDKKTGKTPKRDSIAYSEIVGKTLAEIARRDRRVVAVTAAMKMGTGLYEFEKQAPGRFFDVGIAEQHAITFASALASKGFKPFVSVYSTFLQRAVDQIIHDVAVTAQPVRLLIDRAGIVGEDGETHHGLSDIGIVRNIPNFIYLAPSNGRELRDMLYFAAEHGTGPVAIRFPRGRDESGTIDIAAHDRFEPGRAKRLSTGRDVALIAAGDMVPIALETAAILKENGFSATVLNLLSLKPLDIKKIERAASETRFFVTLENGYISGGIGEHILSCIHRDLRQRMLFAAGFPDRFIEQGTMRELFRLHGLDPASLARKIIRGLKVRIIHEKRHTIRRVSG
ncbi:MAG: 1-deoxy-D-xylulose-5-phosphate synthase [Spirochaetes bacterium]|jgi:1-deoxy-D-xylulose-5-phosphate synthase|nr:1-deoxy-D-xylulose-5-phosphate synthase [Spirochaetota bacterium]